MKSICHSILTVGAILLGSFILQSCNSSQGSSKAQYKDVASQQLNGESIPVSGLPSPVSVNYASGFSITNHPGYKVLKVFSPFVDQPDTLKYVLVKRANKPPEQFPDAQIIEVPANNMVVTSTTHVAYVAMLNAIDVLDGIGSAKYVYNQTVRKKLEEGEIAPLSSTQLNTEKLVAMNPDVLMIGAGSVSSFNNYRLLMKMGIPVFVNGAWLETTPLGRAEWVKAIGALLGKEKWANEKFEKVVQNYNRLKKSVDKNVTTGEKPLVINNLPYKGAWFVPGGDSYMAQYLKDAGADYPWYNNNETGGLKLGFEAVYYEGVKADIWINPARTKSIDALLAKDSRFADFKSVQTAQVYNKNRRVNAAGGNDYWETGVVRPDIVLHDLINIFHTGLLEDSTLYFYQKLPKGMQR